MPPAAAAAILFFGFSAIMASVVISRPATEAAFCRAGADDLRRVDDAHLDQVAVLFRLRVEAEVVLSFFSILPTTTEPSTPAFSAIWRSGASRALADDVDAGFWSSLSPSGFEREGARQEGHAAAGTMPSSTAARVAFRASSTRSLRSFTSTSVAPPTRMTATPPASFARRSCSFSRS
jgi:hypothetical protein